MSSFVSLFAGKRRIRNRARGDAPKSRRGVDDPRVYQKSGQNKKEGDKNQTVVVERGVKRDGG